MVQTSLGKKLYNMTKNSMTRVFYFTNLGIVNFTAVNPNLHPVNFMAFDFTASVLNTFKTVLFVDMLILLLTMWPLVANTLNDQD